MSIGVTYETIQAQRERRPRADGREDQAMWQDLAALTPPLVVCVAFFIGLAVFLRREMSPKRRAARDDKRRSRAGRS